MIPPDLYEFVVDGEARVRGDVDGLSARLVAHRKFGADYAKEEFDPLFTLVLEACAYTGRGALDYDGCLKALFPFLSRFKGNRPLDLWMPLLESIAKRADINKGTIRNELLVDLDVPRPPAGHQQSTLSPPLDAPSPVASDRAAPMMRTFVAGPPAMGSIKESKEFGEVVEAWQQERLDFDLELRAAWDVWIIRSALLQRHRLSTDYLEELMTDDDFWLSSVAGEFAESLTEPPRPDAIGRAAAALLNGRLRYLRPRLYLRAPDSPVIQPIADRSEIAAVEQSLVEEIGYPFVRSLRLIHDELNRGPNLAPRKGMLTDLEAYLTQVLDRLGVSPDAVGEAREVPFDPIQHFSSTPLEIGAPVRLIHAGLVDIESGRRVFKAVVVPIDRKKHDDESEHGSDNESLKEGRDNE